MLNELKQEANRARTENGAESLLSSGSHCLDLFAAAGALRHASEQEILNRFVRAWTEDAQLALRLLFFLRDARGGLGERRVFRVILQELASAAPDTVRRNLEQIPFYGRWDDVLVLLGTPCRDAAAAMLQAQLERDLNAMDRGEPASLLAKWLPSVNASCPETVGQAKALCRLMGLRQREYRQSLSALRRYLDVVENRLRLRDYTFDYEALPGQAQLKYRKAFLRNDGARYLAWLDQVRQGQAVMHTGTLAPYDIIRPLYRGTPSPAECAAMDAAWNAQADFTHGENALVVADGSGSMYTTDSPCPAAVAQSLAIYFAERCTGQFHNHFITFSNSPRLVEVRGATIAEKVRYCKTFNEISNTNLQAVFRLLLDTAVKHHLPQQELPRRLYVISDMEFDACVQDASATNFEAARALFAVQGYRLPQVVFWNVNSRSHQLPVTKNEQGVALVSGNSPRLFALLRSGRLEPYAFMLEVLNSPRYAPVCL